MMYKILCSLIDKNRKIIPIISKNNNIQENKYNKEFKSINDKEFKSINDNEYNEYNKYNKDNEYNKDNCVNK